MDTNPRDPARSNDDPLRWLTSPKSLLVAALLVAAAVGGTAWDARHQPVAPPPPRPVAAVRPAPTASAAERAASQRMADEVVAELWPGLRDDLAAIDPAMVEGLPREAPPARR